MPTIIKNGISYRLSDLIHELNSLNDLERIRYTTSHPKDVTNDLIEAHKSCEKLMPILHLPVQSGSSKILKSMNRKHDQKYYLETIAKILEAKPNMKFSSDFIIGYPGETEKDFQETLKLVNKIKFINSYSFIFSKRPGTPATKLKEVNQTISKRRLKEIQDLLKLYQIDHKKSFLGKSIKVLFENKMKNQNKYFGRDVYSNPVIVKSDKNLTGKIMTINIVDYNHNNFFGEMIKDQKNLTQHKMSELSKLNQKLNIKKIDKETVNIQILDNNILLSIVGEFNANLVELEKLTDTTLFFRGNSITAKGKPDDIFIVSKAIKFLINKFLLTNNIEKGDINLSVKKNISEDKSNVQSLNQLIRTPRKSVIARSQKQSDYIKALRENNIIMSLSDQLEQEKVFWRSLLLLQC